MGGGVGGGVGRGVGGGVGVAEGTGRQGGLLSEGVDLLCYDMKGELTLSRRLNDRNTRRLASSFTHTRILIILRRGG